MEERLRQALKDADPVGLSYDELDAFPGLSRDIAKRRLPVMYASKEIGRHGSGKKGDPFRFLVQRQ